MDCATPQAGSASDMSVALCKYCGEPLPTYDLQVTAMLRRYHRTCYKLRFEELTVMLMFDISF